MSRKKIAALLLTFALALSAGIGVSAAANNELPYAPEAAENDADASTQDGNSLTVTRRGATARFGADKSDDGNVVIVLDPGHGGMDSGAVYKSIRLYESDVNLKIALACRDRLQKYGGNTVYMTHTGVDENTKLTLEDRVDLAERVNADIFISLHINSDDAGSAKGAEVYVPHTKHDVRYNLACSELDEKMLANFQSLGLTNRGVRIRRSGNHKYTFDDGTTEAADYYYVIREPSNRLGIPGMLVEHAFIEGDSSFLRVDANLVSLGVADADAIASQYGLLLQPGNPTDASGRYKNLAVTGQPSDVTAKAGRQVNAAVTATGAGLTYQWYYKKAGTSSWNKWNSQTAACINAVANATWDGMQVYCIITDGTGKVVSSNTATITLARDIRITSQPEDIQARIGQTATFNVTAEGDDLTYQWYYKKSGTSGWNKWNGHNTATTSAPAGETWDGMRVYCLITDRFGGTASSDAATVTLTQALSVTVNPADVTTEAGKSVRFTVKAKGEGLAYQWYYKKSGASGWSKWNGHTTASTTSTANDTWNGMQVYCVITDSIGQKVSSQPAKVTISTPNLTVTPPGTVITAQPKSITAAVGDKVSFSLKANGTNLSYQWYYKKAGASSWSRWNGHDTASTSSVVGDTWNGMQVCCLVVNGNLDVYRSESATVTVAQ